MTFGNMGGSVRPETHAQHMVNMIDHGTNVQTTTETVRFTRNQSSNVLSLETALFDPVRAALGVEGPPGVYGGRRRGGRLSGGPLRIRPGTTPVELQARELRGGLVGEWAVPGELRSPKDGLAASW